MLKPQEPRGASRPGEQDQQQNSLDGAAAHAPEDPVCLRNLCVRDPCVVRGPCAHGARGTQTREFAPDLESGSC